MTELYLYATIVAAAGLGVHAIRLQRRLVRAEQLLRGLGAEVGSEPIAAAIEQKVERELPRALRRAFEDLARELKEDIQRNTRREAQDVFDRPQFHKELERVIEDKLTRGAFFLHVRHALDDLQNTLVRYVDRAVQRVEKQLKPDAAVRHLTGAGERKAEWIG